MNKLILSIFFGIFLLSFISAQPSINEFFSTNVSQLIITVSQDESQANLYLNTSGTSFDMQNITFQQFTLGNIKISKILNDINGQIEIGQGSYYPQFNNLFIEQGGMASFLIDNALDFLNISFTTNDVNNNLSLINNHLAKNPLPISSDRHIIFTKDLTNYTIWNNQGYGDVPSQWKDEIRRIINESMVSINIPNLFTQLLPIAKQKINENNLSLDLSLLKNLDMNYTVGLTNLSDIQLKDGEYIIKVFVERDGITYSKDVKIILKGIKNIEEVNVNDTYTPTVQELKDVISKIEGLGDNNLRVEVFDTFSSAPANTKGFKYLNMTVANQTNATIEFKYNSLHPERVSLYVLEGNSWTKLKTIFDGLVYHSNIPHFSLFVIAEEIPQTSPSSSSSGGGRNRGSIISPQNNTILEYLPFEIPEIEDANPPIDITPEQPVEDNTLIYLVVGIIVLTILIVVVLQKRFLKKEVEMEVKNGS